MSTRLLLPGLTLGATIAVVAACGSSGPEASDTAGRGERSERSTVGVPLRIDTPISVATRSGLAFSYRLDVSVPSFDPASLAMEIRRSADVIEDFVELRTKPSREHLRYLIDVRQAAGVRRVGDVIELLDGGGAPRARMTPPTLTTRSGEVKPLEVTLSGCAYDTSPAAPWGRAVVPPLAADCVLDVSWHLRDDEYPAVVDPAWVVGPSMVAARTFHQAARLPNGRVLVVGGVDGPGPGSEIYDPATDTWATTSSFFGAVIIFRAKALTDGRVLALAGSDFALENRYSNVATYDPATGEWTNEPPLPFGLSGYALTVLPEGRALVTGGFIGLDVTSYAAVFDRGKGFAAVAPMLERRGHHTATLLATGKVLVSGGEHCCQTVPFKPLSSTEVYDPVANVWSSGPSLTTARYDHTANLLPDGRIVVAGGSTRFFEEGFVGSVEVIDAGLMSFTVAGSLRAARSFHEATVLPNGKLLFTGSAGRGFTNSTLTLAETFDPRDNQLAAAGDTIESRAMHTATALVDGRVLVAGGGGRIEAHSRTTELFGTRLGDPCEPAGCPNGVCVSGVCCATASGCASPVGIDAGMDASAAVARDAGFAATTPNAEPSDAATTSYHACAFAPRSRRASGPLGGAALLALVLGGRRRAWARRSRRVQR